MSTAMSPKASALLAYLSAHQGADKGVTCARVAAWFGWSERDVRKFTSELREQGHAVCGHPRSGYYIAETPAELEESCRFLRSRAMHSLTLEARLRRVSLPTLLGQLNLNT
jgi:biotin operon repressor